MDGQPPERAGEQLYREAPSDAVERNAWYLGLSAEERRALNATAIRHADEHSDEDERQSVRRVPRRSRADRLRHARRAAAGDRLPLSGTWMRRSRHGGPWRPARGCELSVDQRAALAAYTVERGLHRLPRLRTGRPRSSRPRARRRTGASSRTSGSDPPGDDPEHPHVGPWASRP